MREVRELQYEVAAVRSARQASWPGPRRMVALCVGVLGGFCAAVVLSMLLSHPAGASVLPGVGQSAVAPPANVTQTLAATVATVENVTPQPLVNSLVATTPVSRVASPVVRSVATAGATDLHVVTQPLRPVIAPVVQPLLPVLAPVVPTLVAAVDSADGLGITPFLLPESPSALHAVAAPAGATTASFVAASAFATSPTVPMEPPAPNGPAPEIPVSPSSASSVGALPLLGNNSPLAGLPPLGLLLPAPMIASLLFVRRRRPELLLDLRYSPPG